MIESDLKSKPLLELFEEWSRSNQRATRTISEYRYSLLRYAKAGITTVGDVTRASIARHIQERLAEGIGISSVCVGLAILHNLLEHLVVLGEFPSSELDMIRKLTPTIRKPQQFKAKFLSSHETKRLIESAHQRSPRAELAIKVSLLSGLRAGELARLRWDTIDLSDRPSIHVKVVSELGSAGSIKGGFARKVPICKELKEILLAIPGDHEGYVFRNGPKAYKQPFTAARDLRRDVIRVTKGTDLEWANFHIFRHTRAATWAQGGVPIAKIACWLGHSLDICVRFYAAFCDGYDPDCER